MYNLKMRRGLVGGLLGWVGACCCVTLVGLSACGSSSDSANASAGSGGAGGKGNAAGGEAGAAGDTEGGAGGRSSPAAGAGGQGAEAGAPDAEGGSAGTAGPPVEQCPAPPPGVVAGQALCSWLAGKLQGQGVGQDPAAVVVTGAGGFAVAGSFDFGAGVLTDKPPSATYIGNGLSSFMVDYSGRGVPGYSAVFGTTGSQPLKAMALSKDGSVVLREATSAAASISEADR